MKPKTAAGRSLLRWIDPAVTDDRMIYAVVKNGPTVGDLRRIILEIEEQASATPSSQKVAASAAGRQR